MMSTVMKTRLIKIGNSQGIRIPKLLREQIHLGEEAEIEIEKGQIVLDQLRTVDKVRLVRQLGQISRQTQAEVLRVLAEMFAE
jgi:antitoxin component of MazEF toxin-antitoxin module